MKALALVACGLLIAGCATRDPFPERPHVTYYRNPVPLLVPQPPVPRPGQRAITPPPIEADICITNKDQVDLDFFFEAVEAWLHNHGIE